MMESELVRALVEAILLTAKGPIVVEAVAEALGDQGLTAEEIEAVIVGLAKSWDDESRGVRLERVAGGWRCVTPPQLDPYLRAFHGVTSRHRLSQAALEVLAIVAHREPVTMPEINFIRGTNSTGVVRTLLDRSLLRIAGRKKVVGKPFLYRTTREFLIHFGLERPEDLPDPEELVAASVEVSDGAESGADSGGFSPDIAGPAAPIEDLRASGGRHADLDRGSLPDGPFSKDPAV